MNRQQRRAAERQRDAIQDAEFRLRDFLTSGNDVTRHHEAWALLELYHEKVVKANRLHRRILRVLRGGEWEIDPFGWWRQQTELAKRRLEEQAKE